MKRLLALFAVWLGLGGALLAWDTKPVPTLPDGSTIQVPLPATEHMQNTGGSDGYGLCVYTSVVLAARWHNVTEAYQLRKFAEGRPGGSYPEKLAADLKTYSARYNVKLPTYVQHTGGDDAFLDLCMQTRRYPGITYAGVDDFYGGTIAHMVNLTHLDAKDAAIQDNNRAGRWTFDSRDRVLKRWKGLDDQGRPLRIRGMTVGGGWAFVWIAPPAPPVAPKQVEEFTSKECGHWERVVLGDSFKWDQPRDSDALSDTIVWVYWRKGEAVGGFVRGKFYRVTIRDGEVVGLGEETDAPLGCCPPNEVTDPDNKGIDITKLSATQRYWINDIEVSQARAYALVSDVGEGLVDDSDKYHLSIVSSEKDALLKLFGPGGALEKYSRRLHVQVYAAESWPAKKLLTSVVTLQEPAKRGGKVVGVGGDWNESTLRRVLGEVFDPPPAPPAPAPEPKIDPPPAPPAPAPTPKLPDWPAWVWATLGLILLLLIKRK